MRIRHWIIAGIIVFLFSACGDTEIAPEVVEEVVEEVDDIAETDDSAAETEEAEEIDQNVTTDQAPEEGSDVADESETGSSDQETEEPQEPVVPDYEALQVNELGHIMVVMYHGIMDNPPYHRVKENFVKDLTFMYEHGYRPISMSDYLSGHIETEAGTTPIVFTFDDALPTTFSLVNEGGELKVAEDTAVDLMEDFALQFPAFGKEASFFIHGSLVNFKGDGSDEERMTWLVDHGYEIGNHSDTHASFRKLGKNALEKEIGNVHVYLEEVLPGYQMQALTYPFGIRPAEGLMSVVTEGSYEDHTFNLKVAFREGPSGIFYPPMHKKFQPYNAPRVRGSEGEVQDLWWFLEYYEAHPNMKYVSDGNPDTLVVPESYADSLREGAEVTFDVIVY